MNFRMLKIGALLFGAGQVGAKKRNPVSRLGDNARDSDKRGLKGGKGGLYKPSNDFEDKLRRRLLDEFPQCNVPYENWVGDGWCDQNDGYNTAACGYDGGDCCETTCDGHHGCVQPFDCKDPRAPIRSAKQVMSVECGPGNIAINGQIGQTFVPTSDSLVDKIAVWIKPNLYYVSEYELELYSGEFEALLATSPIVSINESDPSSWENKVPGNAEFYDFDLTTAGDPVVTLAAGETYSWKLVRKSQYSGAFSICNNQIEGVGYWLGSHPEPNKDYSFKLYAAGVSAVTLSAECGSGNIAINDKIGQTFVPSTSGLADMISVWIKPNLYRVTQYQLKLYGGEFETLLATSPIVAMNELEPSSWENREPGVAGFYDFDTEDAPLVAGETYSWMLERVSEYSGAFAMCGDVIDGDGFWLGRSRDYGKDYSFKLVTWNP